MFPFKMQFCKCTFMFTSQRQVTKLVKQNACESKHFYNFMSMIMKTYIQGEEKSRFMVVNT